MFKFAVLFACLAVAFAEPKPGFLAAAPLAVSAPLPYAAAPLLTSTTIVRSAPLLAPAPIYRSAPLLAPAPIYRSAPLLAPAPLLTSAPIIRSPCAYGACGYGYGYGY